jgi:acyl-CoA thioester hydrolase/1,4-dihydroxy-2-naphthoyl-CoA hydrolase
MISLKKKINFYDCDPAGILFYGNIFHICHSAYEELVSTFKLEIDYWQNHDFVVPIINTNADYLKPFRNGDSVIVKLSVTDVRKSSFELSYECFNQDDELCVEVKTVHVIIDKKNWKKKELLSEIIEGLKFH